MPASRTDPRSTGEVFIDVPDSPCPKCGAWVPDLDGFGVLAHLGPGGCGYCAHASLTDGVCGFCGATMAARSAERST